MLLLAFHVIDVPGDRCHGHNSLLHHLAAPSIRALCPVLAQLLEGRRPGRGRQTEEGRDEQRQRERERGRGRDGEPETERDKQAKTGSEVSGCQPPLLTRHCPRAGPVSRDQRPPWSSLAQLSQGPHSRCTTRWPMDRTSPLPRQPPGGPQLTCSSRWYLRMRWTGFNRKLCRGSE